MGREQPEERRIQPQQCGRQRPNSVQNDLAAQVVPHLDVFLVLVGRPVDLVVTLGLEEKMPGLPADHGYQPADQRGFRRVRKRRDVSNDEADRAQQMQRLIDTAVMIVTMIIPSLCPQFRPKTLHGGSSREREREFYINRPCSKYRNFVTSLL